MGAEYTDGCMACLRCGKLMSVEARFCNSCGADLAADPVAGLQGSARPADFPTAVGVSGPPSGGTLTPAPSQPQPATAPGPVPGAGFPNVTSYAYPSYRSAYSRSRTDDLAIASLVCALASYVLLPLAPAVAAIALGFVARERIRDSGGELGGRGIALAGILLGVANLFVYTALLLLFIFLAASR